jgi:hypothetical protein
MAMRVVAACVVVAVVVCCSAAWAGEYQVEETPLVALDDELWPGDGTGYWGTSPYERPFTYIVAKGKGEAVVVDGREGPVYDAIEGPVFRVPGTAEVAYAARKGDVVVAVIAGREGPAYDEVGSLLRRPDRRPTPDNPQDYISFSDDGSHVAYKARKGDKWLVVVDGEEGPEYDEVTCGPLFADTGHCTYAARKGDNWVAVIDGRETPEHGWVGSVFFSPDGTRVVYEASDGPREARESFYVVDGHEWPGCPQMGCVALHEGHVVQGFASDLGAWFAPGGRRFYYVAKEGEKWVFVDEGREGPEYDGIYGLSISPDGQHVAYKAWRGPNPAQAEHVVVLDGVEGPVYGAIGCLAFSPDGKRFAYDARPGAQWGVSQVVVADGQEGPRYQGVGPPSFSPDSRHLIYTASVGDKSVVVLDGEESRECDRAGTFCFLPDGSGLIYEAQIGNRAFVVRNGQEGPAYPHVGELKLSPDGQHFVYVAYKEPGLAVVVDGKEGPLWDGLEEMPVFSADGNHMAYAGERKGQCFVVFDSREEGGYPSVNLAKDRNDALVVGPHGERVYTVGVGSREPAPRFDDPRYDEWVKTRKPGRRCVVVNGQPGPAYDEIVTYPLAFQEDGTLEYLAKRDGMLFRVTHTPAAQPAR